jgi:hypothetical protein
MGRMKALDQIDMTPMIPQRFSADDFANTYQGFPSRRSTPELSKFRTAQAAVSQIRPRKVADDD